MGDFLESATREIERLNKIARQFEDEATRLRAQQTVLVEALDMVRREYLSELIQQDREVVLAALATLDVPDSSEGE